MKNWGVFLIIIGIICGYTAITMNTSVETGGTSQYGIYIPKTKVNNIGLMNQQTNLLIGAGIAFISGIMLIGFSSKSSSGASRQSHADGNNKKCPCCAEIINKEAVICRYCGKEQVPVEIMDAPEESLECYMPIDRDVNSIKLNHQIIDYRDKYDAKKIMFIVVVIVVLMLVYMALT